MHRLYLSQEAGARFQREVPDSMRESPAVKPHRLPKPNRTTRTVKRTIARSINGVYREI